jgi:nitroreductase
MDFNELLKKRRSVRNYQDKQIDTNLLKEILHETCIAPSASNRQTWRFVIIKDKALMQQLSDESKKNLVAEILANPKASGSSYLNILQNKNFNVFYNAPCLVLIVGDKNEAFVCEDCTLAASYFMFTAANKGLGTCWVALGSHIQDPKLRQQIGLTDEMRIVAPIIIGYPAEKISEKFERNAPQILKIVD